MDEPPVVRPATWPPLRRSSRRPLIDLFPSAAARQPADAVAAHPYAAVYGMREPPFSLEPDPRFLYHSASHDRALDGILGAVRQRGGLVVVSGQPGAGKTILCRALGELLDQHTLISVVSDVSGSAEEFLTKLLVDFGVMTKEEVARGASHPRTPHSLTERLHTFLISLGSLQASAIVVIDDAQNLPSDALERLSALATLADVGSLLHIVLVGQPSIHSLLKRPEHQRLDERVIVDVELEPLEEDEIAGYIAHRVDVAGGRSRVEFAAGALHAVFVLTRGVPRLVNLLCDRALARGSESATSAIDTVCIAWAAADLDMTPPAATEGGAPPRVASLVALLVLVLLTAAGALLSIWMFDERIANAAARWEEVPPSPTAPLLRQPIPLGPLPVPE